MARKCGRAFTAAHKFFFYSPVPEPMPHAPFFDLLIDTRNRWREALYARRLPHGLFLSPAMHFLFSEKRPPFLGSRPQHLCDQLIELITLAAGMHPPSTGALPVPDEVLEKARQLLPPGHTYVGLAPGAGNLEKAWPRFKFEKVAVMQAEKSRVPVFILGPQELNWYDELQATVPSAKFPLQEHDVWGGHSITLDHTLALGSLLDVAVANDSGVGHMLAASDCPLISLFGPTSPEKLAPRVTHGTVIRAQTFGSPHIRAIRWEAVNDAIDNLLSHERQVKIRRKFHAINILQRRLDRKNFICNIARPWAGNIVMQKFRLPLPRADRERHLIRPFFSDSGLRGNKPDDKGRGKMEPEAKMKP